MKPLVAAIVLAGGALGVGAVLVAENADAYVGTMVMSPVPSPPPPMVDAGSTDAGP